MLVVSSTIYLVGELGHVVLLTSQATIEPPTLFVARLLNAIGTLSYKYVLHIPNLLIDDYENVILQIYQIHVIWITYSKLSDREVFVVYASGFGVKLDVLLLTGTTNLTQGERIIYYITT